MYLFYIILCFLVPLAFQADQLNLNIAARSAILINAETGAILFAKEPSLPCHPASISKIATALYVLEKKSHALEQLVTASQEAVGVVSPQVKRLGGVNCPPYRLTSDGTHMSLRVGESLTLGHLLHGLLIASANDAANVIAEYVSSSIPAFMDQLNAYLKEMGCRHTSFVNPSGLPHPQQITTAEDMAKITIAAMKYPLFREIVLKAECPRPKTNKQPPSTLFQGNKLLRRGPFFYPKAIGVKTGYTDAGHNLVAAAREGDRTLIAVLLYCGSSAQRFKDAIALFEAAFSEKKVTRTLLNKDHEKFTRTFRKGKSALKAELIENLELEYFPSEEIPLQAIVHWYDLTLPIQEGQQVGEVRLTAGQGSLLKTAPLFAKQDVGLTFLAKVENVYVVAKAKKVLIAALMGLSLVGCGLFTAYSKQNIKK